jgi:hypothetical protein
LERDRKKYDKQTGNEEYDELLNKYRSFEEKKTEITEEYERKRGLLKERLDSSGTLESERMKATYAMQQLEKDYNKSVSELAKQEITDDDSWKKLFDDLDNLTARQIDILVNEIESKFESLSVEFNPIDLKAIRDKLTEAKAIVLKDNPFKAVGVAIREVFNDSADGSKKSAEQIKKDWNNLGAATEGAFKFVTDAVSSCDFLKDAIGEIGSTAIGTLSTVATVAIATATAIKSTEKASVVLAIIQAALVVVQAVAGFIKSIINSNDKKLEKKVQEHLNNVKTLQKEYQKLERIVDKSLGEDRYTSQKDALANLKKQQGELASAAENERKKKKSDSGKIAEYEAATEEIGIKMLDMIDRVREEVMGGTAKSIADDLGNAFIDAFASGEDALGSFKKKADEVISGIIRRMLIQKLIEKPVGEIIDRYSQKWVNSNGDVLNFDEIMKGASKMGDELKTVGASLSSAMESLPDEIKKYLMNSIDDAEITSLSGAIKGASQESINVLTGYMNNSAITQREEAELIRQALLLIANIDMKLGVSNNHLASIDSKLNSANEVLRSQGITG